MLRSNKNKNYVLVTGGAGYIGSHTCKALFNNGYTPVVYDNLSQGHRDFVRWGPLEKGDISDQSKLNQVMSKYDFNAVIHFAAHAYVAESVNNPLKYYDNNVIGSLTLFKAMLKNNIKKIIFSSTCATYGIPSRLPIIETHNQSPINPYGSSKLFIEKILSDFDSAYGFKSIILRYFNAAGADPDCEIGESHSPETHLIPLILNAISSSNSFVVFGNDYETPDGTCIRDYIHVNDLATAHIYSLDYLIKNNTSDNFNIGAKKGYSVKEVINEIKFVTHRNISINYGPKRIGDPPILISNCAKANKILNWYPQFSDLNTIIRHAWKWHLKSSNPLNEELLAS